MEIGKKEFEVLENNEQEINENELESVSGGEDMWDAPAISRRVNGGYVTSSPNDRLCPRCGEYKAFVSEFLYEDPTKCYSKICCTACGYQGSC